MRGSRFCRVQLVFLVNKFCNIFDLIYIYRLVFLRSIVDKVVLGCRSWVFLPSPQSEVWVSKALLAKQLELFLSHNSLVQLESSLVLASFSDRPIVVKQLANNEVISLTVNTSHEFATVLLDEFLEHLASDLLKDPTDDKAPSTESTSGF